jgi:hypothetical protein
VVCVKLRHHVIVGVAVVVIEVRQVALLQGGGVGKHGGR